MRIKIDLYVYGLPRGKAISGYNVVLILDCISDLGSHVRSNLFYLICLSYLIKSSAATNGIFFKNGLFSLMRAHYVLNNFLV